MMNATVNEIYGEISFDYFIIKILNIVKISQKLFSGKSNLNRSLFEYTKLNTLGFDCYSY